MRPQLSWIEHQFAELRVGGSNPLGLEYFPTHVRAYLNSGILHGGKALDNKSKNKLYIYKHFDTKEFDKHTKELKS